MKIGVIGCGYVFDHYFGTIDRHPAIEVVGVTDRNSERSQAVARRYGLSVYPSNEAMLADSEIAIVCNLTSIESHFEVSKAALLAGKHVYSEKPLTLDLKEAQELCALASGRNLVLSCAPSNALSETMQTLRRAVQDGSIGSPKLVYAEFDDNPVYLMKPETWRSRSGAPWPYVHEYEMGCTVEHVGYHLTWLCSIFGPVESVTAFSKCLIARKTDEPLHPADTPDFSVACLNFRSGVVARVTCSIVAPLDHRIRVIGDQGMLSVNTYRHYRCPVYLERFSALTLNARKAYSVRTSSLLQHILGIGGRKQTLVNKPPPGSKEKRPLVQWGSSPAKWLRAWKKQELGVQDKCIGIAEMIDAIQFGRPYFPSPEFTLHLTELTLVIQGGGSNGSTHQMTTTFEPEEQGSEVFAANSRNREKTSMFDRFAASLLERLHQH